MEILAVGREMLRGERPDRNSPYLAEFFSRRGAWVHRITLVDDTERAVASAITEALERGTHLLITTGGLGPAADDRTLAAVAAALQRPLSLHPGARQMVEAAYRRLRSQGELEKEGLNAAREKMCMIPVGGEPIANALGISPGVLSRLPGGAAVLNLPGVPLEARAVLEACLELLRDLFPHGFMARREVETPVNDESVLRPILDRLSEEFPSAWIQSFAPGFGDRKARTTVTIEVRGHSREEAEMAVEGVLRRFLDLAGSKSLSSR